MASRRPTQVTELLVAWITASSWLIHLWSDWIPNSEFNASRSPRPHDLEYTAAGCPSSEEHDSPLSKRETGKFFQDQRTEPLLTTTTLIRIYVYLCVLQLWPYVKTSYTSSESLTQDENPEENYFSYSCSFSNYPHISLPLAWSISLLIQSALFTFNNDIYFNTKIDLLMATHHWDYNNNHERRNHP